jgi:prefoldin subunit 5
MKYLCLCLLSLFVVGCASRVERLNRDYEKLSRQVDAMQDEQKAITRHEISTQELLKAKQVYEKSKGELRAVRERNHQNDIPLGPELSADQPLEKEIEQLKNNHDVLSDRIRELEKKRSQVAKEQMGSN